MKVGVLAVGRADRRIADALEEYRRRAERYWNLEVEEVRPEKATRGRTDDEVRAAESDRLLERVPAGLEIVALTRDGRAWSSRRLARYLNELAVRGHGGAAFLVGGALGLDAAALRRADRRLSLSAMTLPHDLARLMLMEQIYRAGTIVRGEPYHKERS